MLRLKEFFGEDSTYFGDNGEFFVVYDYSRDSSTMEISNVKAVRKLYGIDGKKDSEFPVDVKIERASHWAVGWIEYIIINPDNAEFVKIGEKIAEDLKNYPLLDEDLFSAMQWEQYENDIESAIKVYNLNNEKPFSYEDYADKCIDLAYGRDEIYIDYQDLERIVKDDF